MTIYLLTICAIAGSLVLSGCGSGQLFGPTFTPTATATLIPTTTPTPSPTLTPTVTPSPIPLSELNLEPILILQGDLPAGFSGAQVRTTPVKGLSDIQNYQNTIYQQFEYGGEAAGGVSIFLFDSLADRDIAYQHILDGFGESRDDAVVKITLGDVSTIGERGRYSIAEILFFGMSLTTIDLAVERCHALIEIRMMYITDVDAVTAYAKRLDNRLVVLVCQ